MGAQELHRGRLIDHVHLVVRDLSANKAFYITALAHGGKDNGAPRKRPYISATTPPSSWIPTATTSKPFTMVNYSQLRLSPHHVLIRAICPPSLRFRQVPRTLGVTSNIENSGLIMKAEEREELLQALEARFDRHMHRHAGIAWGDVRTKLEGNRDADRSLQEMEATGGEPDVIGEANDSGHFIFCDCSPQSPAGRRSTCYDAEARAAGKEHRPENSAVEMAVEMGIELLTEEWY